MAGAATLVARFLLAQQRVHGGCTVGARRTCCLHCLDLPLAGLVLPPLSCAGENCKGSARVPQAISRRIRPTAPQRPERLAKGHRPLRAKMARQCRAQYFMSSVFCSAGQCWASAPMVSPVPGIGKLSSVIPCVRAMASLRIAIGSCSRRRGLRRGDGRTQESRCGKPWGSSGSQGRCECNFCGRVRTTPSLRVPG